MKTIDRPWTQEEMNAADNRLDRKNRRYHDDRNWCYDEYLERQQMKSRTLEREIEILRQRCPHPRVPKNERYWPLWNSRRRVNAIYRQDRLVQLLRIRLDRFFKDTMKASTEHNRVRWKLLHMTKGPNPRYPKLSELHETKPRISHFMINSKMAQLRNGLLELFNKLERKEISPAVATEMNNAAGKVISSAKVELEYRTAQLRNKELVIEFMEAEKL